MRSNYLLFTIYFFCGLLLCNAQKVNQNKYTIFFIPLDVEFYMPTNIHDIENRAFYSFQMQSNIIDKIINHVSLGKAKLEPIDSNKIYDIVLKITDTKNHVLFVNKKKELYSNNVKYLAEERLIKNLIKEISYKSKGMKKKK